MWRNCTGYLVRKEQNDNYMGALLFTAILDLSYLLFIISLLELFNFVYSI